MAPARIRRRLRPGRWLIGVCMVLAVADAAWATGQTARPADCTAMVLDSMAVAFDAPQLHAAGQGAETLVAQACKPWPFDASITLAAVTYPETIADEWGERSLRLLVAMVATEDGRVLAGHSEPRGEHAAFALSEGGLQLDTARYDLAPGVRAFGVIVQSSARGPSCPDTRFNDELTLFVFGGDGLRPVFNTYLDWWERVEGEPCNANREKRLVTDEARLSIGIEPTARHGFADLRVMARIVRDEIDGPNDTRSERRTSRVVRYDGRRYDTTPIGLGNFWSPNFP